MNDFMSLLEEIIYLFETAHGTFDGLGNTVLGAALLVETLVSALGLLALFAIGIFTFVVMLVTYLGNAIPLYAVAKKAECKQAWYVWIPVFQNLFCVYVLSKISGKEEFDFADGKVHIKRNNDVLVGYVAIYFLGSAIVTALITILNFISILGQIAGVFASVLYVVPAAALAIVEYVYLRDTINVFKPDEKTNRTHAFIIVLLDSLVTAGWARNVYLLTMMKLQPLPPTVLHTEFVPNTESTSAPENTNI